MKKTFLILAWLLCAVSMRAQFTHGTTGLLEMPTADMQKDKTFMLGGGYLDNTVTPMRWNYNTWNYYLNVTIFPWLEVAYTCTIFNEWVGANKEVHMRNQDRNYSARLRLWKEGWWKSWTPQIVLGANDLGTSSEDGLGSGDGTNGNGFWNRYYLAVTKHVDFQKVGTLGVHVAYLYNNRIDNPINGPALGANFRFALPSGSFWHQAVNGINLMAEYDSKDFNIGGSYSVWKDRINAFFELSHCKHPSAGISFKICLK